MSDYDSKKVTIALDGTLIKGFPEEDIVSWKRNEGMWSQTVGAHGEVTRNKSNNKSGMLTIYVLRSSASIPFMNSYIKKGETSANNDTFSIRANDGNVNRAASSINACFEGFPEEKLKKGVEVLEYLVLCPELEID
jgi:hypothetical protein